MPYRNWPEILKIGQEDAFVMLVLCRVRLDQNNSLFVRLRLAFPECFSDQEVTGPCSYSVIQDLIAEEKEAYRQDGTLWMGADDVLHRLGVPFLCFEVIAPGHTPHLLGDHIFPMELQAASKCNPKEVFEWKGARFVIIEVDCDPSEPDFYNTILAIPEELIFLDQ